MTAKRRRSPAQARLAAGVSALLMLFVPGCASGTNSGQTHATPSSRGASQSSGTSGAGMNGMNMHDMKGMQGMSGMSGSDMSGMDMGNPDPSWHYTGPPLPPSEVQLINAVWNKTEQGHAMQDATCTTKPTTAQRAAASRLVSTTDAAVAKYRDINAATADGYVPITTPAYVMVHYIKFSNMGADKVLDPNHVQSLVYIRRPNGQMVLVAGMYLMPGGGAGPMPGGCLTQWHKHTNLCMSAAGYIAGFAPCPAGMTLLPTPQMLHVWQVPVPGGSLAVDPTDLQVAQAAEMYATGQGGTSGPTH